MDQYIVTSDGEEHPFSEPPIDDVQIIVQHVDADRRVLSGKDYYYYHMGRWWGTDNPATALYHHSLGNALMHGRFMEGFDQLLNDHLHR